MELVRGYGEGPPTGVIEGGLREHPSVQERLQGTQICPLPFHPYWKRRNWPNYRGVGLYFFSLKITELGRGHERVRSLAAGR